MIVTFLNEEFFNPLSTDQSKIGRRRLMIFYWAQSTQFLFDLHEWGIIWKIFLLCKRRCFLFRKFVQKWESYGRSKLGKSTLLGSVVPELRLLASMATQKTIRGWAMKQGGSKLSTRKRTSFIAALQAKNKHIFVLLCSKHNLLCVWSNVFCIRRAFALGFLRSDSQREDLCNGMFIVNDQAH